MTQVTLQSNNPIWYTNIKYSVSHTIKILVKKTGLGTGRHRSVKITVLWDVVELPTCNQLFPLSGCKKLLIHTLKIEAGGYSETLLSIFQITGVTSKKKIIFKFVNARTSNFDTASLHRQRKKSSSSVVYKAETWEWSDPTCRKLPWFFLHCKSTHNKIHCQNSSC
jgi:hypothetical protein